MFFRKKTEDSVLDWLEGCKQGKPKSQEMLYKHYYGYAMTICLQYAKNEEEGAEILNDSFFKVFTKIHQYESTQPFKTWFRRIIINTAISYYRKNNKHTHVNIEDIAPHEQEVSIDALTKLSAEDILKLLQRLPESQRIVFNLFEIEGYGHEEIAEKLNIAASTSRVHLLRAKQQLRQLVEKLFQYSNE